MQQQQERKRKSNPICMENERHSYDTVMVQSVMRRGDTQFGT